MKATAIAALVFCLLGGSAVVAQDWSAVQALPAGTPVRVGELGGRGGEVEGRIQAVDDARLMLLVGGTPVEVPRASIRILERVHRDPVWNGLAIGAALSLILRAAFAAEACAGTRDPGCTIAGTLVGAGLGAFVDVQIKGRRVVYRGPQPVATLLRIAF